MRIIAGTFGGRLFDSPKSAITHPMSDKARGGLFNALGDLSGLGVLDAFAGSGALSFEAISRGAKSVLAIESDSTAQKTIAANIANLSLPQIKLVRANAGSWLRTTPDAMFDVVVCDPPYDDLQPKLLAELAQRTKPGGIAVFSLPPKADFKLLDSEYQLVATKSYGDIELAFYRRIS